VLGLILLTIGVIALAMLAMAVGAIFSNRCLRGSCGGPDVLGPGGESLACETCPLRRDRDALPTPAAPAAHATRDLTGSPAATSRKSA
jgi:hypothetical protein